MTNDEVLHYEFETTITRDGYERANNVVHRFSYSNQDRMLLTIINSEVVSELIKASNKFVSQLIENWKEKQGEFLL